MHAFQPDHPGPPFLPRSRRRGRPRVIYALLLLAAACLVYEVGLAVDPPDEAQHAQPAQPAQRPAGAAGGDAKAPATGPVYTNHLIHEKSPYLLQHAHNPVDWYPWGSEAFERAKKENKPIFLSVGYSTCHWCHVMERESFEDPGVAKLINDNFVAIKVDREERPDVDAVYMAFVQATTGDGGWPMTVFLTTDLKPFYGGTYFPPASRDGQPGLKELLPKAREAWDQDHDNVVKAAEKVTALLRLQAAAGGAAAPPATGPADPPTTAPAAPVAPGVAALEAAYQQFHEAFDDEHGGFGTGTKFPRPVVLNFLLHEYARTGRAAAREMVLKTLRAMADGGIHDHLGGGFHRYATDSRWFLPHFEKMLYDQAQLACSYLDAWQITHDPLYADVARDVLDYVLRDMTGPEGQFYCAEDADSVIDPARPDRKGEGAFYVWTADEIRQALGEESAPVFDYRFGVEPNGNVARDPRGEFPGKNVLSVAHTIDDTAKHFSNAPAEVEKLLAEAMAKLLEVRSRRPRPARDDKALTAWNALMISAFARAGQALQEPRYTQAAVRSAEFIRSRLYDPATHALTRRWRDGRAEVPGFLDDYACYLQALIDLYENAPDVRWLKLALDVQRKQDELFWDAAKGTAAGAPDAAPKAVAPGGYFRTTGADASVLLRFKDAEDEAEPSGNSVSALNLLRLAQMTGDEDLRRKAAELFQVFAPQIDRSPTAAPQLLVALDFSLQKPRQIVLAGRADSPDTRAMLRAVYARYLPDKVLILADGGAGQEFFAGRLPFLKGMAPIGGKTAAFVCQNYACQLPTNDLKKLGELLDAAAPRESPTTRPGPGEGDKVR